MASKVRTSGVNPVTRLQYAVVKVGHAYDLLNLAAIEVFGMEEYADVHQMGSRLSGLAKRLQAAMRGRQAAERARSKK